MSTILITTLFIIISLFLNNVFTYQFYYYCYNITRNTEKYKHKHTKEKFRRDSVKATIGNVITGNIILRKNNCVNKAIFYTGLVSSSGNILINSGVNKEMGLVGGLSSLVTDILTGLNESDISSNIYNGQRFAENASRNNSTNVKPKTDKDGNVIPNKYLVTDAKKDGDTGIYNQDGNKIGETLFDDDYLNRNGNEIDFDTKIGKVLGKDGLYVDNAEEMINALIDFEI